MDSILRIFKNTDRILRIFKNTDRILKIHSRIKIGYSGYIQEYR